MFSFPVCVLVWNENCLIYLLQEQDVSRELKQVSQGCDYACYKYILESISTKVFSQSANSQINAFNNRV